MVHISKQANVMHSEIIPLQRCIHDRIQNVLSEEVQHGQRLFVFSGFLVAEVRQDPNTTISGPSSTHQYVCWLGSFVIFQGIQPVLNRNPIFNFCDFSWGGCPRLDPRT